jgi:hypothetical protein
MAFSYWPTLIILENSTDFSKFVSAKTGDTAYSTTTATKQRIGGASAQGE